MSLDPLNAKLTSRSRECGSFDTDPNVCYLEDEGFAGPNGKKKLSQISKLKRLKTHSFMGSKPHPGC